MLAMIVGKWLNKQSSVSIETSSIEHKTETSSIEHDTSSIEELVKQAKVNIEMRNELISQYTPFMIKVTSKVCKQYIDRSRDEFSIAMEAFNEAIETYDADQGSHFLSFAEMVIRRRVIDYIRKETRQTRDIFLEQESKDDEEQVESLAQINASISQYHKELERERRREEIQEYQLLLKKFDITFSELVECCPKHIDARENAKQIAKTLASKPELANYLMEKKQLPLKQLLKFVQCSRKTVERNRKYIIAMALIYIGQFESLRVYIEPEQIQHRKEG
ncbi:RNA polymerase, sigma 28 subunit, SigI [Caldalkalibacillus thermarum TA2.A1]|uniref:RNA polymerase sigma factor SigI n=2 Tax=Caldalkalibacillus thermarum (strain TA2.A1) TaxID=986075 RepID=F5L7H5_CALTT|nr:RNA polymerase, sigma 28 subunit, SigI [Caldalkalibacillus thermarum TA2.A1]